MRARAESPWCDAERECSAQRHLRASSSDRMHRYRGSCSPAADRCNGETELAASPTPRGCFLRNRPALKTLGRRSDLAPPSARMATLAQEGAVPGTPTHHRETTGLPNSENAQKLNTQPSLSTSETRAAPPLQNRPVFCPVMDARSEGPRLQNARPGAPSCVTGAAGHTLLPNS